MAKSKAPASAKPRPTRKAHPRLKKANLPSSSRDEPTDTPDALSESITPLNRLHARPARALIGWIAADAAPSMMAGPGTQHPYSPDILERAERARAAVGARAPLGPQPAVITEAPAELGDWVKDLEAKPFYRVFLNEGWSVRVADLCYVRALQSVIHIDHADERTQHAVAGDVRSLAAITIPTSRPKELVAIEPSPDGRRWTLSCRNPHLRILGPYSADLDDSGYKTKVYGFQTELSHSLVQVVRWRGIYVLRDGYHRSYGLLARKITSIPVIYRDLPDNQLPVFGPSILDPSIYLSDRSPLLTDYFEDTVSAPIEVRRTQKTYVIQVVESDLPIL
jgi:hypothetical protein